MIDWEFELMKERRYYMSKRNWKCFFVGMILAWIIGGCVCAVYGRDAEQDSPKIEDLKLRIEEDERGQYIIAEDAEMFRALFAIVPFAEYHMSRKAHEKLAKHIAMTIGRFYQATNGQIRTGHYEYGPSKGTNAVDMLIRNLGRKFVTDEVVYP